MSVPAYLSPAAFGGSVLAGYCITIMSPMALLIGEVVHLSAAQVGELTASTVIGSVPGAIVFGRLADASGGRISAMLAAAVTAVFSVASTLSSSIPLLIVARVAVGVGVGGEYVLANSLAASLVPQAVRGRVLALNWGGGWLAGEFLGFAAGYFSAFTSAGAAWRIVAASSALPAFAVAAFRIRSNRDIARPQPPVSGHAAGRIGDSRLRTIVYGSLNYVCETSPFYALSVLEPVSLHSSTGLSAPRDVELSLILLIGAPMGVAATYFLVDRKGRLWLNYVGYSALAAAIGAYIVTGSTEGYLGFVLLFALQFLTWFGPSITANTVLAELWPQGGGTGAGVSSAAGRLGAIATLLVFPVLVSRLGLALSMAYPLAFSLAGVVFTYIFGVETMPGKASVNAG
ncbi:MAG: MFS transporter [Candidatus Marsarchaeota archaeon]|nr:MFS transporter [Candidatus Marsarchaeota archaeon]